MNNDEVLKLAKECDIGDSGRRFLDGRANSLSESRIMSTLEFASKLRAKDAEKEAGTTGNKYRAELYDEVWNKARKLGYANVTDALEEIASLKAQLSEAQKVPEVLFYIDPQDVDVFKDNIFESCSVYVTKTPFDGNTVGLAAPTYKKE